MRWGMVLLPSFHRWQNQGLECVNALPKVTQLRAALGLVLSSASMIFIANLHSSSPGQIYGSYFRWEVVKAMTMPMAEPSSHKIHRVNCKYVSSLDGSHQCGSNKGMINMVRNNFAVKLPGAGWSIRDSLALHHVIPQRVFSRRLWEVEMMHSQPSVLKVPNVRGVDREGAAVVAHVSQGYKESSRLCLEP